jgi:uncharacterized SAM-binding protein YcdF (DUF218 family)
MFFVLSKTLNYLVQPLTLVMLLLLLSFFLKTKHWKKRTGYAAVGFLVFFSNSFIANEVMRWWELPTKSYSELRNYEAAILLTGITVVKPRGPQDRVYFNSGADRVTHTLQLYKLGLVNRIIISGGSGKLIDDGLRESLQLKDFLLMAGVPDSIIYTDANSDNTYENAIESKKIIDRLEINTNDCLLVTSAFHMRRALACFRKANADMEYFTCDFRSSARSFTLDILFVPKLDALLIWQRLLKEWVGFAAYKMAGYV